MGGSIAPIKLVATCRQRRRSSSSASSDDAFWTSVASIQLAVSRLALLLTNELGEADYRPISTNAIFIIYSSRSLIDNQSAYIGNIRLRTVGIHALAYLKWRLLTPWWARILTRLRLGTFLINDGVYTMDQQFAINAVHVALTGWHWKVCVFGWCGWQSIAIILE